jgi:hypothetical protein
MNIARITWPLVGFGALALAACDPPKPSHSPAPSASAKPAQATVKYDALDRATFNRVAVQMDLPLYWIEDKNADKAINPDETAALLFYPNLGEWVDGTRFTAKFEETYKGMVAWAKAPTFPKGLDDKEKKRRSLVIEELDQGKPTLVFTDFSKRTTEDKAFVRHMLAAAKLINKLYARQRGLESLEAQIPKDDPSSHAAFRRNWGPKCGAPKTEKNPDCSAVPTSPEKVAVESYPADTQKEDGFCDKLAKLPDGEKLMSPFVVVKKENAKLVPVPVTEAFKDLTAKVAKELRAAADGIQDPKEEALKTYLKAAAQAFTDNNWEPADEAWAKMNATNSKWYLRVGPDEVYWGPCNRKAGFHVSFALINQASLTWQKKLEPVQQDMEDAIAKHIGAPYKPRKVTFHLPDFIDIVFNAGDARSPLGATVGQSLPNWGPVANEGRGRTVVMSNLYTDPDSKQVIREQAESMLDKASMAKRATTQDASLFSIILHEATHNFGPSHEYKVKGKTDDQVFGGPLASTMEELKAQTGALWFVSLLKDKKIIDEKFANENYVDAFTWALNHIARGMYADGKPKPYSHLAAIQVGFLMDEGAITFDPKAKAANGKDEGAFTLHFDKLPAAIDKMMKVVGNIKAKGDKKKAEELVKKYVDGDTVPMKLIAERSLRHPKATFLYGISL